MFQNQIPQSDQVEEFSIHFEKSRRSILNGIHCIDKKQALLRSYKGAFDALKRSVSSEVQKKVKQSGEWEGCEGIVLVQEAPTTHAAREMKIYRL